MTALSRSLLSAILLILLGALAGCKSAVPVSPTVTGTASPIADQPPSIVTATGWSPAQPIAVVGSPVFQPAIAVQHSTPLIGWWAHDPSSPAMQLTISQGAGSTPIVTGVTAQQPDDLALFSSVNGILAIWRDQNTQSIDPADRRLYVALLDSRLHPVRPPHALTDRSTTAYQAIQLPTNETAIAWTGHTTPIADALWLTIADPSGNAIPAVPVAVDAAHPAISAVSADRLIVGWLTPASHAIWAIQTAAIPIDRSTSPNRYPVGAPITLGIIQPGGTADDHVLDSFSIAARGATCAVAWSTAPLKTAAAPNSAALIFPCGTIGGSASMLPIVPTAITLPAAGDWPLTIDTPLALSANPLSPVALTLVDPVNGDSPAVVWLNAGSIDHVDRLGSPAPSTTIGQVALAADPATGKLWAAWGLIEPDGTDRIDIAQQVNGRTR